jgi:GTP cyclohydrolase I
MNQEEKNEMLHLAAEAYGNFLSALGFDWENDPHTMDTPKRVAKAFVEDLFAGLYTESPKITSFPNDGKYTGMVFQGDIEVHSICQHHHLPFIGKAYVAYIPGETMIGLSKLNRIVEWMSRRPQVQETLTMQIHNLISEKCTENAGVAVMIKAKHQCACLRGVKHDSTMVTSHLSGAFKENEAARAEFYKFIDYLR